MDFGSPTDTQRDAAVAGVPSLSFASDQKSTPFITLLTVLILSSTPSGMTSPWQNQADFWWTWSVVSPGLAGSIGQPRVTAAPLGLSSGQKYGLATLSPTW